MNMQRCEDAHGRRESGGAAQHTNRISNASQNPPIVEYIYHEEK